jgi:hypothetical protein
MKKPTRQKTRNVFIGIVLLAIIIAVAAWVYLSVQKTTLSISSEKVNYFTVEEPEITVRILNPKNANSGEVAINYPEESLILEESNSPEGVSIREEAGKLYFELSSEFFENGEKNLVNLKFDATGTGVMGVTADEERSFLNTPEGELDFAQFNNAEFNIGLPEESENPEVRENAGTFEGV